MRENPDGFPSSPGASRGAAPIPVYGWDFSMNLQKSRCLAVDGNKVMAGGTPANPATLAEYANHE